MATDQLALTVTCPECDDAIPMPTSGRVTGRGEAEIRFDTSAIRTHIASHGVRVEAPTPSPGQQIISNAVTWPTIGADEQRRTELFDWLRANGIEPNDVPTDSTVTIEPGDCGSAVRHTHVVRHAVYLRNATGFHYEDPATNGAAREDRTVPLIVPLPDGWPQAVSPIEPDTALTHPTPEIRYTYPHHATINTQEGAAP